MIVRTLVLLALLLRLAPGPGTFALAAHSDAIPICHADTGAAPASSDGRPTHPDACALCPLCLIVTPAALLTPGVAVVPLPSFVLRAIALLPPATGPPPSPRVAAHPRGPPV